MKRQLIQIFGIAVTLVYGGLILWVYATGPQSLDDASIKARRTIENTVTKGEIVTGTYAADPEKFAKGIAEFNADNFIAARSFFENADPERRDGKTQFYIAYSYYRQGFGKFSSDDELFAKGLEVANRLIEIDRDFVATDPKLGMKTAAELKREFEEGMRTTISDFNPLKLTRERK